MLCSATYWTIHIKAAVNGDEITKHCTHAYIWKNYYKSCLI